MTKTITWAITQAAVLAVVWAGYIEGVQGARYVFGFYVCAVCLPLMCIAALADGVVEHETHRFKRGANGAINGAALFVLAWHGSFIVATAWLISITCAAVAQQKASNKRKSAGLALQQQMIVNMDATEQSIRDARDMLQRTGGKAHPFRFKDQT